MKQKDTHKKGLFWQKIVAIHEGFSTINPQTGNCYEWLMWVDADILFANNEKRIEDLLAEYATDKTNVLVASDYFLKYIPQDALNTGVFLLRNNDWGHKFIEEVLNSFNTFKNETNPEQIAFGQVLARASQFSSGSPLDFQEKFNVDKQTKLIQQTPEAKIVPQRAVNPKFEGRPLIPEDCIWRAGDLLVHFIGLGISKDIEIPIFLENLVRDPSGKSSEWHVNGSYLRALKAHWNTIGLNHFQEERADLSVALLLSMLFVASQISL